MLTRWEVARATQRMAGVTAAAGYAILQVRCARQIGCAASQEPARAPCVLGDTRADFNASTAVGVVEQVDQGIQCVLVVRPAVRRRPHIVVLRIHLIALVGRVAAVSVGEHEYPLTTMLSHGIGGEGGGG